jgi:sugar phosphate isomerase/epimerase
MQWLRSPDEVAEAHRPGPGRALTLPPFVNAVRKHGQQVIAVTTNITDADSPPTPRAFSAQRPHWGITHYWWGNFRYEAGKTVMQQLEALKPRVAKLAALSAKYKMTAMYHHHAGTQVGCAILDFLYVLKDFDPKLVGFHYDIDHATNAGGAGTWINNLCAAGPYIARVSVKDSYLERVRKAAIGDRTTLRSRPGERPARTVCVDLERDQFLGSDGDSGGVF